LQPKSNFEGQRHLTFVFQEHNWMLKALHNEIDQLRQRNRGFFFNPSFLLRQSGFTFNLTIFFSVRFAIPSGFLAIKTKGGSFIPFIHEGRRAE